MELKKRSLNSAEKPLPISTDNNQHFVLSLAKQAISQIEMSSSQNPQNPVRSDFGIHMNHLSFFIVCGGHIFIGDVAVLSKGIESRIEVLCI